MKFFKSILCAAVAMGMALPTMAQTGVQGVVLSKDKEPLMGVTVTIPAQNIAVVTNSDGAFRIDNAQPGKDKIVINSIGHREFSKTITIKADTIQDLGNLKLKSKSSSRNYYMRVMVSYNMGAGNYDIDISDNYPDFGIANIKNVHNVSFSCLVGIYLSQNHTLSLEWGFEGGWAIDDEVYTQYSYGNVSEKHDIYTVHFSIPIMLGYEFQLSTHFSIRPYAGVCPKLYSESNYENYVGYPDVTDYIYWEMATDIDTDWAIALRVGTIIKYRKLALGVSFDSDLFKHTYVNCKSMPQVSLGLEF